MYPGASKRCELGDFLLVHDHLHNGQLIRRAVIVQAKVFYQTGVRTKNSVQLDLYQNWPRFTYESWPGGINTLAALHARIGLTGTVPVLRERDLRITGRGTASTSVQLLDEGCRYGMIDVEHSRWGDPQNGMNPWRLCSAQAPNVYTSEDGLTLGSYLIQLIAGNVGRSAPKTKWPASLNVACHWSLMVMELMSILPKAASSTSKISFLAATPNLKIDLGGFDRPPSTADHSMDEGAFGVIHAETSGDLGPPPRHEEEFTP
jgi:hypothetical protein